MTKKVIWLVLLLAVLGGICGFFWKRSQTDVVQQSGNVTVEDDFGRQVELNLPVKNIVSLSNADTEIMLALGVEPLAVVDNPNASETIKSKVKKLPSVGRVTSPDLEIIAKLKPDLVLAGGMPFHTSMEGAFMQAKIPVLFQASSSYQDILKRINFIGTLTGKTKEASKIVANIEQKAKELQAEYKDAPKQKILIVWGTPTSFNLASSKTFVGDLMALFPVENLADEFVINKTDGKQKKLKSGFVPLDPEYLIANDVDAIFIITHGVNKKNSEKFLKAFRDQKVWKNVSAVREGKVYELSEELFTPNPNVRVADSLAYLAKVLYETGE